MQLPHFELCLFASRLIAHCGFRLSKVLKNTRGRATAVVTRVLQLRNAGNIVMFHIGRSGSTVLADLLDQHPQIYWDGEIYERILAARDRAADTGQVLDVDPLRLIGKRVPRSGTRYYGFEVKQFHLELLGVTFQAFLQGLTQLGPFHAVILERKNYLRKIVSSLVAHKSGTFHRASAEVPPLTRVHLDVNAVPIDRSCKPLLVLLQEYEAFFQRLKDTLVPERTLKLTYEGDICPGPGIGYERVRNFLGIDQHRCPVIRFGQTNPFRLRDMLDNFHEVASAIRGTSFEWMVEEDLVLAGSPQTVAARD